MRSFNRVLASEAGRKIGSMKQLVAWMKRDFAVPLPEFVKRAVLFRYALPDATWVETGTFRGWTTRQIRKIGKRVISLEPAPAIYEDAKRNLAKYKNVEVVNATSEEAFPELLPTLSGNVNFWLDGHFSGGDTFEGKSHCPIPEELAEIEKNLPKWDGAAVMIDDVRECGPTRPPGRDDYPSTTELIEWAERNGMGWLIEYDIFVASTALTPAPRVGMSKDGPRA